MTAHQSRPKSFETRMDRFRRSENLDLKQWAEAAGLTRHTLVMCRRGTFPRVTVAGRILHGACVVLGRDVAISEIFDVGDEVPVFSGAATKRRTAVPNNIRRAYGTSLDRIMVREQVAPTELARAAGITRQTLQKIRAGTIGDPRIVTVAAIVGALRKLTGKPIRAVDLYDFKKPAGAK